MLPVVRLLVYILVDGDVDELSNVLFDVEFSVLVDVEDDLIVDKLYFVSFEVEMDLYVSVDVDVDVSVTVDVEVLDKMLFDNENDVKISVVGIIVLLVSNGLICSITVSKIATLVIAINMSKVIFL